MLHECLHTAGADSVAESINAGVLMLCTRACRCCWQNSQ